MGCLLHQGIRRGPASDPRPPWSCECSRRLSTRGARQAGATARLVGLCFSSLAIEKPDPREKFKLAAAAGAAREVAADAVAAFFRQAVEEISNGLSVYGLAAQRARSTSR